jgi:hypothetical protein
MFTVAADSFENESQENMIPGGETIWGENLYGVRQLAAAFFRASLLAGGGPAL